MWEGVDYLFIDDISMICCNFLLQISEALTEAKGKTTPFGGMNLITAGDFDQLPPVGQPRLFSHVNTHRVACMCAWTCFSWQDHRTRAHVDLHVP
jgi:hypothetical protein